MHVSPTDRSSAIQNSAFRVHSTSCFASPFQPPVSCDMARESDLSVDDLCVTWYDLRESKDWALNIKKLVSQSVSQTRNQPTNFKLLNRAAT